MKSEDVVSAEGGAKCGATGTVKGKGKSKATDSREQADAPPPPQPSSDDTGNATFNPSSSLRQTSIQATESIVRPSTPSTSSRLSRASLSNTQATPQPPPSRDPGSVVEQKDQVAPPRPLPPTAEDVRQAAYQAVSSLCAPWKEGDLEFRPLPEEWADIVSWEVGSLQLSSCLVERQPPFSAGREPLLALRSSDVLVLFKSRTASPTSNEVVSTERTRSSSLLCGELSLHDPLARLDSSATFLSSQADFSSAHRAQYNYYSWISEIEARAKCPQKVSLRLYSDSRRRRTDLLRLHSASSSISTR